MTLVERMQEQKVRQKTQHLPEPPYAARFSPQAPWDSLSQISTGLCPYIPSSYLSKVWSPINVNGTGLSPKATQSRYSVLSLCNPANEPIYVSGLRLYFLSCQWKLSFLWREFLSFSRHGYEHTSQLPNQFHH